MRTKRSLFNAIAWSYSATWGDRAFSALVNVFLAALLGPRDFGIVAIALVYVAFIQMFLEQGLSTALIQRQDLERKHLDTVFWINLLTSLGLAGLSILLSRWWAEVNHLPGLTRVIAGLSLSLPLQGMSIVQFALLQRDMDFKNIAIRNNVAALAGGIAGIGMAYAKMGVFALVAQQVVKDLTSLALMWGVSKWRPGLHLSWSYFKELLSFSIPTFAARLGIFFDGQAGVILLGAFLGPVAAGLYRLADRLTSTVYTATSGAMQNASLPEFSRNQDNPVELRKSVLACMKMSATLTLPAMAGLLAVSDSLLAVIGPQWIQASNVLKILCAVSVMASFTIYTNPLLQALGKPRYVAFIEWGKTIAGLACLAAAGYVVRGATLSWQIAGVATSRLACGVLLVTPVCLFVVMRLSKIALRDLVATILPSLGSALSILVSVRLLIYSGLIDDLGRIPLLAVETIVGAVCGLVALYALDSKVRGAVRKVLQRRSAKPWSIEEAVEEQTTL